jgi:hypothetical protein
MAKKHSPIKDRLLLFLQKTGLTNREFYRKTGFPNGFLNKVENFGSDKLEMIRKGYPFLNIVWLLSGEGDMYIAGVSQQAEANTAKPKIENTLLDESALVDNLHHIDRLTITDAEKLMLYKRIIDGKNMLISKYIQEVKMLLLLLHKNDHPPASK